MPKQGGRASGGIYTRKELKALGRTNDPPNYELETYNVKVHYKTPDMRRPKQQKYEKDLSTGKLYEKKPNGEYEEISDEKYGQIVDEIGIERGDRKGEIGKPFTERVLEPKPEPVASEDEDRDFDGFDLLKDDPEFVEGRDTPDGDLSVKEVTVDIGRGGIPPLLMYLDKSGTFWNPRDKENLGKLRKSWKIIEKKKPVAEEDTPTPEIEDSEDEEDTPTPEESDGEELDVESVIIGIDGDAEEWYVDEDGNLYDIDKMTANIEEKIPLHSEGTPEGGHLYKNEEGGWDWYNTQYGELEMLNDGLWDREKKTWTEEAEEMYKEGYVIVQAIYDEFEDDYRPSGGIPPKNKLNDEQKEILKQYLGRAIKYEWNVTPRIDNGDEYNFPNILWPELHDLFPQLLTDSGDNTDPRTEEEHEEAEEIFEEIEEFEEIMRKRNRARAEKRLADEILIAKLRDEREELEAREAEARKEKKRIAQEEEDRIENIRIQAEIDAEIAEDRARAEKSRMRDDDEDKDIELGETVEETDWTNWDANDAKSFLDAIDDFEGITDKPAFIRKLNKIIKEDEEEEEMRAMLDDEYTPHDKEEMGGDADDDDDDDAEEEEPTFLPQPPYTDELRNADLRLFGLTDLPNRKEFNSIYKKLIIKFHPDRSDSPNATKITQEITLAYRRLIEDDDDEVDVEIEIGVNEDGLGTVEDTDFTGWDANDAKTFLETIDDFADQLVDVQAFIRKLKEIIEEDDDDIEGEEIQILKILEDKPPILSSSKPAMGQFKRRNKVELTAEQQAQREKMLADRAERKKKKENN